MLCRVVLVSKLNAAVEKLEQGEELGAGAGSSSGGTLLQYFIGKGRPFYTAATHVLEERQQELVRETVVNDLSATRAELEKRLANGVGPTFDLDGMNQA